MTNAKRAIVTTSIPGELGFAQRDDIVPGAQQLDVAAGHLHVVVGTGKTGAVYAPGFWQTARLDAAPPASVAAIDPADLDVMRAAVAELALPAADIAGYVTTHYLRPLLAAAGVANPERYTVFVAPVMPPAAADE